MFFIILTSVVKVCSFQDVNDFDLREMIGLLIYAKNQPQNDTKTPFDMKKYNELSETSKKKNK